MGLEHVLEAVRSETETALDRILSEAKAVAADKLDSARKRAENDARTRIDNASAEAERIRRQGEKSAEIEAHRRELLTRREAMLSVKKFVLETLRKLPDDKRSVILNGLLKRAAIHLPDGRAVIRSEDINLIRDTAGLTLSGDGAQTGGVIVESPDGAFILDMTFEQVLDTVWRDALRDIADILFKK